MNNHQVITLNLNNLILFSAERGNPFPDQFSERGNIQLNSQNIKFNRLLDADGWKNFLAKARSRFISQLIISNSLADPQTNQASVLELVDGQSRLASTLAEYGIETTTMNLNQPAVNLNGQYSLGVSHTLLEHCENEQMVEFCLDKMAPFCKGMVHQVHETDIPTFEWDPTHQIRKTRTEWNEFFEGWAKNHQGWTYLGNHQGFNGRPSNHVLEKNGQLPFYKDYSQQLNRRLISEITAANIVSISRIPLLLTSFAIAKDNPLLLSALLGATYSLDAADGYIARRGLGNSKFGGHIDIFSDHIVELMTMFEFAYGINAIPKEYPWILTGRNVMTDFLRLYNAFSHTDLQEDHPHKAFGTFDRFGRALSGGVKVFEAVIIPIVPSLGLYTSSAHVLTSLYRGIPVLTSARAKEIYAELLKKIKIKKKENN
ncbi:CDP-alcohol phosphatidyltransferase family protein [Candidatus Roizmanbacteria bacterium]|nr:CDP-alcohol phosphatidyltransferase family protein [Candidatus Roizmanbacteria bacterium]